MLKKRLIAVIILRDGRVVQSVRFKHTNVIHDDPLYAIECFNQWAVDEIIVLNVSKSQESKLPFLKIVERISEKCFSPLSIGGWITDDVYARNLLNIGADKIVVNTLFHSNPNAVRAIAEKFGRQCLVASIDFKNEHGKKNVWVDRGNKKLIFDPLSWAKKCESLGAGEIFLNSIDRDGFRMGYDLDEVKNLSTNLKVPIIAFGGVSNWTHLSDGLKSGADAVAAANIFHYTEHSTIHAKSYLINEFIDTDVHIRE